jgi:predicted butyrate kinase (DUF1464 family)
VALLYFLFAASPETTINKPDYDTLASPPVQKTPTVPEWRKTTSLGLEMDIFWLD